MNWKSIIATALITGIVTVITSMILFWWKTEKSELTYNSIQSIPFDDTRNSLFIQQIEIQNSGEKPIEDVVLAISFTDEIIEKSRIEIDKAISHKKESDDKTITLKIDSLNSDEGANISVLYKSSTSNSTGAAISLRGKGITGTLIGSTKKSNIEPIIIALVAAYTGIFAFLLSTRRGREKLSRMMHNLFLGRVTINNDTEYQKHVIASILSLYGYPEKAKEYLNNGNDRQFWVESDLLAAEAIIKGDNKLKKDTLDILYTISIIPYIAKKSKAICFYNIARLYQSLGPGDGNVKVYLDMAKQLDVSVVKERLAIDPILKEFSKLEEVNQETNS